MLQAYRKMLLVTVVAITLSAGGRAYAQASYAPTNKEPNPFPLGMSFGQLPDGRKWGSTAGVDLAPDGTIWAYDRCGANSCVDSKVDPILHFDTSGKLIKAFGAGMFNFPHGIHVDRDGNVWVTDHDSNAPGGKGRGQQVFKFDPNGKVLMTLGKAGVSGNGPDTFNKPSDVLVAPNGDIFVADGHGPETNARIVKFDKTGKFIKEWGGHGSAADKLEGPHALAMDSKGRLFVGDRTNNRVQVFDQDGKLLASWKQFGRPSGIFIDRSNNMIYVTDSESREDNKPEEYGHNPGVHRGIRWGSVNDGKVIGYIPDPKPTGGSSISEGVAVDRQGNIYGAEVGPRDMKKYVKK